jgi:hypothetical protein
MMIICLIENLQKLFISYKQINIVNDINIFVSEVFMTFMAELLNLFTPNHLPLAAVGSNPARDFGFCYVWIKLPSKLMELQWFYSSTFSCLK